MQKYRFLVVNCEFIGMSLKKKFMWIKKELELFMKCKMIFYLSTLLLLENEMIWKCIKKLQKEHSLVIMVSKIDHYYNT